MPDTNLTLIRNGQLETDLTRLFDDHLTVNSALYLPPDEAHWMVSFDTWLDKCDFLIKRKFPVAVLIPSDADISRIVQLSVRRTHLDAIAFIAINFPTYTDGRGFSLAHMLRNQLGWKGELRAVGDVMIDTMHYLARCGFDSFLVKAGHDAQAALNALTTFTVYYQKCYSQPLKAQL